MARARRSVRNSTCKEKWRHGSEGGGVMAAARIKREKKNIETMKINGGVTGAAPASSSWRGVSIRSKRETPVRTLPAAAFFYRIIFIGGRRIMAA